jgi:hypothetical protein
MNAPSDNDPWSRSLTEHDRNPLRSEAPSGHPSSALMNVVEANRLGLSTLDADLRQALGEAGIALHDCDGPGRGAGGCCLTPRPARNGKPEGIIVAWTCADSLTAGGVDGDRYALYETVQETMTTTLWAILGGFGYPMEPFGNYDLPLVIGARPARDTSDKPWDIEDLGRPPSVVDEPLYGDPLPAQEITSDGRLGRPCARCGTPCEQLHFPQARTSAAVCCGCWDGKALIASDNVPAGEWTDLGPCPGHPGQ